jgi:hypothetical protein
LFLKIEIVCRWEKKVCRDFNPDVDLDIYLDPDADL